MKTETIQAILILLFFIIACWDPSPRKKTNKDIVANKKV